MVKKTVLVSTILLLAAIIYGCGQVTPQINSSSAQPGNLSIRGTVYAEKADIFTIPLFLTSRGDPYPGAYVALSGSSGTWSTTSDAKGEYVFAGVPDGSYHLHVTAEGYQDRSTVLFFVVGGAIKPINNIPADQTMTIFDVDLWGNPIITSYSPASGEVISNNQVFTVKFNEAMDTSTVKVSMVPQGVRTADIAQSTAQLNMVWSNGNKTLTITPRDQLISNEVYQLVFDWNLNFGNILLSSGPRDLKGNLMVTPFWLDFVHFPFEINACDNRAVYRVASGGVPGAPSNLQITYNTGAGGPPHITTEADAYDFWINLYSYPNTIFLSWDSPASGQISGYNIYTSNGSSSEYLKLNKTLIASNEYTTNGYNFEKTFWPLPNQVPWSDPVCSGNYPFINNPVRIKVVAVNGDGEGPGVEISAIDNVSPKLVTSESANSGFTGALLNDDYYLPAIPAASSGEAYLGLSEPVNPATVSGNVTISGVTLTATLLTQSSGYLAPFPKFMSVIKLDAGTTDITGKTVTITSGLKDLAGNAPVAGSGDTIVLP